MDEQTSEQNPTRELGELFSEGTEDILRALVESNDELPTLHVVRGSPRTGKTTKLPYALHLLSREKVLCLQPTEHACSRIGSYVKQQLGLKTISFSDAWSPQAPDTTAAVVYAPVQDVLLGCIKTPGESMQPARFSFIIFDEAHHESTEYELALTSILMKQATSSLRPNVKIILMSSYLRPNDDIRKIFHRLPAIRSHELPEPRPGGPVACRYTSKMMELPPRAFSSWVTQTLKSVKSRRRVVVFVPYHDFHAVSVLIRQDIMAALKECPPIHIREIHHTTTSEALMGTEEFILLAQFHTCSRVHIPRVRQVLCPHWMATRKFDERISKEVIDAKRSLADADFRFIESSCDAGGEVFYSCTLNHRSLVIPFGQPLVQRLDPITYIFIASYIFPGSVAGGGDFRPQASWSVPIFCTGKAAIWSKRRLGPIGYKLLQPDDQGVDKVTVLGETVIYFLLSSDLGFNMSTFVALSNPELGLGWTLATAIGASSGVPVLQLKSGELRRPDKYTPDKTPETSDPGNRKPVKLTFEHIKQLRALTMGTAGMTERRIKAIQASTTFQECGDVTSDTAFLLMKMNKVDTLVTSTPEAEPFNYGPWVDTSGASSNLQHMLARLGRISRLIGWDMANLQCFPFDENEECEDGPQWFSEWAAWLPSFAKPWTNVHMFNLAFVTVLDGMRKEVGEEWAISTIDNVLFTAYDFCSGFYVHLDPGSTVLLSQFYANERHVEGFYVTYTNIREVASGMWEISGITMVPKPLLDDFMLRVRYETPWGIGLADFLRSTMLD